MRILDINTKDFSYPIVIGTSILNIINIYIEKYDKVLIISNEKVGSLYKDSIFNSIEKDNLFYFEILDGEKYKNLETACSVYDFMISNNFTRNSCIISLGGGVVCDLGGYIASTYMRGIDFIQVPTTLLAQVDASIGGKVAINLPKGKNLIGSFKQPKAVVIDIDFLKTLSLYEFKSGLGEVIKHGLLFKYMNSDSSYIDFLETHSTSILNLNCPILEEMIFKSCEIKKYFVEQDELETGIRAFLNLGHTYGHTLETLFDYSAISHGEAIAKGIIFSALISKKLGYIEKMDIDKIENIFKLFSIDYSPIKILNARMLEIMQRDKKNSFDNINFIVLKKNLISKEAISANILMDINNSISNRYIKSVIDIGTNSCRVFVAEVSNYNSNLKIERKIFKDIEITKLGEGVNKNQELLHSAMERTCKAITKFANLSRNMGAIEIKAFATSATRDSKNRDIFIQLVKNKANVDIICIPGELEAKLSFLGNSLVFNEKILIVDIGGGSTEFILGQGEEIEYIKSFNVGAVRATEIFFKDEDYSENNIQNCSIWIKENLKELISLSPLHFTLVGVAGTVTTNVSVAEKMEIYNSDKVDGYNLTKEILKRNLTLYLSKNLEDRKLIPGLDPKRADIIIAGTLIILTVIELLNRNSILISESDNLEGGMIYDNSSLHS